MHSRHPQRSPALYGRACADCKAPIPAGHGALTQARTQRDRPRSFATPCPDTHPAQPPVPHPNKAQAHGHSGDGHICHGVTRVAPPACHRVRSPQSRGEQSKPSPVGRHSRAASPAARHDARPYPSAQLAQAGQHGRTAPHQPATARAGALARRSSTGRIVANGSGRSAGSARNRSMQRPWPMPQTRHASSPPPGPAMAPSATASRQPARSTSTSRSKPGPMST